VDLVREALPTRDTTVPEFSIAVKDYSKKGQDDDAIYFDVKTFNGQVDRTMEYIEKGHEILKQTDVWPSKSMFGKPTVPM
jgi:hypothetical protein